MSEQDLHAALRLLREEVGNLVKTVPGPVSSVSVRLGECSLEVSWAGSVPVEAPSVPPAVQAGWEETPQEAADPALTVVTAPLVGTFYLAPEPGAAPFVRAGDRVEAGQTIGIVEAMKLMNPVAAEHSGEVVEVLAGNAEPVEYGQDLVRIRVDG
ncbi:acetyl-CoA carboxylase biotin carboxyl carrier protein [Nonomuraea sp. NPDC050790]|uniref:acetyl-CoA carboxylase biotin carboxyl carrier protein n=1 Tax=Nonomuraea sp. NPDC050790 TaxID=3364371 RepID=UPI00378CC2B9